MSGIGYRVNTQHLIFLPVARLKNLQVPCKFPVGPSTIDGVEQVTMEFIGVGLL